MTLFDRLKRGAGAAWTSYVDHPFPTAMAEGTLSEAAFRFYLVQDYLFLIEFARAYGLAVYKAPRLAEMRAAATTMHAVLEVEMELHVRLCAGWGLSIAAIEDTPPAAATLAYTSYVLNAGARGDLLTLKVALAPCVIGYHDIAERLARIPASQDPANPYCPWIAEYSGSAYRALANEARAELDSLGERYATPARLEELQTTFTEATRLEADFWEMGWRAAAGGAEPL